MQINVDLIRINLSGCAGHEHRIQPIVRRALEFLQIHMRDQLLASGVRPHNLNVESMSLPTVSVDLNVMHDEVVAERLAQAMYKSLHSRWRES